MVDEPGMREDTMPNPESESAGSSFDMAANVLLERYGFIGCALEPLCYSENHTYRVTRLNGKPVATLRICRPGYRSLRELQAEIDWLFHLNNEVKLEGIEIVRPILALDGSAVQVVTLPDGGLFHGVAFAYMDGVTPDEGDGEAMCRLFRRLGSLAAALHEHTRGLGAAVTPHELNQALRPGTALDELTQGLGPAAALHEHDQVFEATTAAPCELNQGPRPGITLGEQMRGLGIAAAPRFSFIPPITRPVWDCETALGPHALWGDWRVFVGFTPQEKELLERAETRIRCVMAAYGKPHGRFGLIHADMRLANLLVEGDILKLLDFDDCAYSWHLFDLAASLSFIEARPDLPDLVAAWLEGYRAASTAHPLEEADVAVIPSLIMMRRLQLTAWLATRHDSDPVPALLSTWKQDTLALAARYLQG